MNKSYLLAIAAALMAAPLAFAHEPVGTLRNYCEDPSEWTTHDYGPPGDGHLIALGSDGNLVGDCNGDTIPADYDGHLEWALGGGWLAADSGDGVTGGSIVCHGEHAHHPQFGPISVFDAVQGATLTFWVAADTINLVPPTDPSEPNCGDFESDEGASCTNACTVTFLCGLDGTYQVYVGDAGTGSIGAVGHIVSP